MFAALQLLAFKALSLKPDRSISASGPSSSILV